MKTFLKFRSIRNKLLTTTVVTAIAVPMAASASVQSIGIVYDESDLNSKIGQKHVYDKLKNASRKLCGSPDLRLAGSLRGSNENEACYEDTLTAAVERLDSDDMTALHTKNQ